MRKIRLMKKIIPAAAVLLLTLSCPALAWNGYVVKVIDGDSIRVRRDGTVYEIRLYGIDTPEYLQPFGKQAARRTRRKIWKKNVTVEPMDVDRYGRIVALISSDGHLLNRELVDEGTAWVYPKYCKRQPLCRNLKEEEKRARVDRLGLWKEGNPLSPWRWKRLNKKSSRRHYRHIRSRRQH